MNGTTNGVPTTVASIPLTDADAAAAGSSIGSLVKDATSQVSTLVRAEVALAKAEVTGEAKKAVRGAVFFVVAAVIGLYSTFYLFFAAAEALDLVLPRWAAFLIVWGVMVLIAAIAGLLGWRRVKKLQKPRRRSNR